MEFDVMNLLKEYAVVPVAMLCWIVGYALKHYVTKLPSNYIPLILGVIGVGCVVWINLAFTFDLLLSGVCSAALAVWAHQVGKQILSANEDNEE